MKLLLLVLVFITSSQSLNNEALVTCTDDAGDEGVMCDGKCYPAALWCNDMMVDDCEDPGVMTNDLDLCSDDEFWKQISCNMTVDGDKVYPGERCTSCTTGTRNYCFYPQGPPKDLKSYLPTSCDCVSSQSINYDALVPCSDNQGMMCNGCLPAAYWCNDKFRHKCGESGVMSNDPDLCSDDERWKQLSCDLTLNGTHYPGERCSGCVNGINNFCFYPKGSPYKDRGHLENLLPTTCDCDVSDAFSNDVNTASTSTVILVVLLVIIINIIVCSGVFFYNKKKSDPSHEPPTEVTQVSEMGTE